VLLGGWFEVPHLYDSDFHLLVYRLYTTPCIYLLKNLNRTVFFKKKKLYFVTDLFSHTEPSLQIYTNDPDEHTNGSQGVRKLSVIIFKIC